MSENYIQGILDFCVVNTTSQEIIDLTDIKYDLIKYGIFEENSDIRAHVSDKKVFVFKTKNVIETLKNKPCEKRYAYQPNYPEPTVLGFLVKPNDIADIRELPFLSWAGFNDFKEDWNTIIKGKWAINCVIELIRIGRFPFWIEAQQTQDTKIDISGTDIIVAMNKKIQVKCDYPAVRTGNLYIQMAEKNPYKFY